MNGNVVGVLLTVLLLAGNAFFVGAEFAVISARRDRLETLVAQGKKRAQTVIDAGEHLSIMLAASQLGITICSILLGKVAEPAIAHSIEIPLDALRVPTTLQHTIAFIIAMSIVVVAHIILGEMVPKNIALAGPETAAMLLVPPQMLFVRIMRPAIWVFNHAANATLRLLRVDPKDELEVTVSTVELSELLGESYSEGLMDAEEHQRLVQALDTTARTVADVLIPLDKVRTVPERPGGGTTLGAVETAVEQTGFSRYPVRTATGRLIGYVHLKDVLDLIGDEHAGPETPLAATEIRELPQIPTTTSLADALALLRRARAHLGEAINPSGTAVGIVALEDLVEEYVGTVRDNTHRLPEPGQ